MANSDPESGRGSADDLPASSTSSADPVSASGIQSTAATIEQARKFLQDERVRNSSWERRCEFLKSKGIAEDTIRQLQEEIETPDRAPSTLSDQDDAQKPLRNSPDVETRTADVKEDRPPIITYPEFLATPPRPPPLITVNGFLNTLYAFGGVSTLIYGTSRYVLEPMVGSLTEARLSFHETARENLDKLVAKLENTVTEIPAMKKPDSHFHSRDVDELSEYEDPTELFHRDVGVQTSFPSTPVGQPGTQSPSIPESLTSQQARRLKELVNSVKVIQNGFVSQTEGFDDAKAVLDALKEEVDQLNFPLNEYTSSYMLYSGVNRNEKDDEIKRAKENIRRVKGVLLSSRSFPALSR
ncbi:hypothetical protein VTK73DRAFT_7311 [Phialemonium thermophilum]|uniref:Peroxisomal membrane protein PEX14 n=1 Tax=Phialemonium thermophilum TaxID=223376 RepID=A0ABR3WFD4_9PEZI